MPYAWSFSECKKMMLHNLYQEKLYFVIKGLTKVPLLDRPVSKTSKNYITAGDLVVMTEKSNDFSCVHYLKSGNILASGWVHSSDLKEFIPPHFGNGNTPAKTTQLTKDNDYLISISKQLPIHNSWAASWRRNDSDLFKIKQIGKNWSLNINEIGGVIFNTKDEALNWEKITIEGAAAFKRETPGKFGPCDIVMIQFNNALSVIEGDECRAGLNGSYPDLKGIYWKQL